VLDTLRHPERHAAYVQIHGDSLDAPRIHRLAIDSSLGDSDYRSFGGKKNGIGTQENIA
jgi:hypothetical protein